jgi:hypothetical protein
MRSEDSGKDGKNGNDGKDILICALAKLVSEEKKYCRSC